MSTSAERLHYLLQAYAEKNCTADEVQELNGLLEDDWNRIELGRQAPHIDWENMYRQIMAVPVVEMRHSSNKKWYRIAAAAVLLGFVVYGWWFVVVHNKTKQPEVVVAPKVNDIKAPAANRAMITLADGQKIFLDSAANGMLATQGNASILKLANGQIAYNSSLATDQSPLTYNTLSNPRGSNIIAITLADGTKVWLNSESSLKYPATFTDKERRVEVTGEAYFEVVSLSPKGGQKIPFIVSINTLSGEHKADVEVLGTHFNINAYDDEAVIRTTLLEGKVRIKSAINHLQSAILQPEQQATIHDSRLTIHDNINTEQVTAWTTGFFQFNDLDIETILRQLSRWYNVDVAYESHPAPRRFGGRISNQLNLSEVLRLLESNGIHSRLEGRKIILLP